LGSTGHGDTLSLRRSPGNCGQLRNGGWSTGELVACWHHLVIDDQPPPLALASFGHIRAFTAVVRAPVADRAAA
jgi:hypothetical protein